ncbi:MAG: SpoIIE family protein phosphatase [Cyclobacteriaceae bacterium]
MIKKTGILFLYLFSSFVVSQAETTSTFDGSWEFYWKKLYTPSDFVNNKAPTKPVGMKVPGSWTTYKTRSGASLPAESFATYRKRIRIADTCKSNLGLVIPAIWSASKVWVNGQLVDKKGIFDEKGKELEGEIIGSLVKLPFIQKDYIEVIVQVSNTKFFLAGMYGVFKLGNYDELVTNKNLFNTLYLVLLGGLFVMAVYHLILFFFRRKATSALYFSLLVLLMLIRTAVFGDHYAYEYLHVNLNMGIQLQANLYYVSTFLMIVVGLWYVKSLYPSLATVMIIKPYTYAMLVVCLYILIVPIGFVFKYIAFIAPLLALGALYTGYILIRAIIKKRKQYGLQILGIVILLFAGINDILFLQRIELTGLAEALPIGFMLFLIVQMVILARDFSVTYSEVEVLSYNLEQRVLERTSKINEQRKVLKESNQRIGESIDYASKIQSAMLPSKDIINELFPQNFIFYRPKDVLSGDFYFADHVNYKGNDCAVIVAADCTGHGIPGAMMSVMGSTILKRLLEREKENDPGHILDKLDENIQRGLKQAETDNHDGMDLSIVYIDAVNKQMHYAAANNYVSYVIDGKQSTVRGERSGVGGVKDEPVNFTTRSISWENELTFYIFSDGYQDQFGGRKGKKFLKAKFHQLLKDISEKDIASQYKEVTRAFDEWKGDQEQVDDVLVVGVKVD